MAKDDVVFDDAQIVWDDAYSVGFELVDEQHRGLVRMTNELLRGFKDESGVPEEKALKKVIRDAIEYAQVHFYTEEKYMRLLNYPDLDVHKKEHESFVVEIMKTVKDYEAGKSDPLTLAKFLKQWLLNHIAVSDKKYAPYFKKL